MNSPVCALLIALTCCGVARGAVNDPPERVGRLGAFAGQVTLQTADSRTREAALRNYPLSSGDRIFTADDSRAEVSLGSALLELDDHTDLEVLALETDLARVQIRSGRVLLHVGDSFNAARGKVGSVEVQAAQVTAHLEQTGDYQVTVAPDGRTDIVVLAGEASVRTPLAGFQQRAGERAAIAADQTVDVQPATERPDRDRHRFERRRGPEGSRSAQHVAAGVVGYEDLDAYGRWHWVRELGMVWEPTRVASSWAPYRFGEWIWKSPWGWTWVDASPWGFAPFHYGRWVRLEERWCWVPGPRQVRAVYAPALVAWVRDPAQRGSVGWFPLGPGQEYVPSYRASESYRRSLNLFASVGGSGGPAVDPEPSGEIITWAASTAFTRPVRR